MTSSFVVESAHLGKSFQAPERQLVVLDDVTFALAAGESCAVIGPSGSGKTTLLGLCAGLDAPSEGHVRLLGHDLGSIDEDGRARIRRDHVGFVFQSFQLFSTLTALENVLLPLELRGDPEARGRATELLEQVGLESRVGHRPGQLSGGEQQRVALARAFAIRPDVLFADEPTGNLDSETARPVLDALFDLRARAGTTLLLVTHDVELAQRCDRILRLRAGRLVEDTGRR